MKRILVALILSACIAPAHNVTADTISFSSGWMSFLDSGIPDGSTGETKQKDEAFVLPQFDPSLGALSDVTFNLTSNLSLNHEITVWGFGSSGFDFIASSDYTLSIVDSVTGTVFQKTFHNTVDCVQGGGICSATTSQHAGEMYDDSVSVAPLAGYQGVGDFDLTRIQLTELTLNIDTGEVSHVTGWLGELEVVYTYNVVPVPAAVWLFGSALGLLGWMRRKTA